MGEPLNKATDRPGESVACRESAKGMLRGVIRRKQRELAGLQVLHDSLPDAMLPEADEALWSLLCAAR